MTPTYAFTFIMLLSLTGTGLVADDYRQEILAWRTKHEEKFKSPTGWLALTGHYWLSSGDNSFGPGKDFKIALPPDAAGETSGKVSVTNQEIKLEVTQGSLSVNGQAVQNAVLHIAPGNEEVDSPDKLQIGQRLTLQLVRRAGRLAIRVRDSQSQAIQKFQGKHWFGIDPKYRITATYKPFDKPKSVKIINVKGDEVESQFAGTLQFELDGQACSLDAILEEPDNLFIIFKDKTNGKSSYGAGRFLDVPVPKADQPVVLDFNKVYSPPCAWSPHTLCPIPPKQNHLPVAIEAGERK